MKKRNKLKLGLFIITGFVLFISTLYYVAMKRHMFGDNFELYTTFRNVTGLQSGNNIRLAGINVGTVSHVMIVNDTTVKVAMVISKDVQRFIKKNSVAVIGTEGLMGNKIVNIESSTEASQPVEEYDVIPSTRSTEIDDILDNLKITTENAAVITDELAELTFNINSGRGAIGKLFTDSTFALEMENAVKNIRKGTFGFSQNMEALKENWLFRKYYKNKLKEQEEKAEKKKESDKKKQEDANDE